MKLRVKQKRNKYEIGYKKPPIHSQFKKGISGNPHGRPKGEQNSISIIKKIADKEVSVKKNGKETKISTRAAVIMQLFNQALSGNLKAISMVLPLINILEVKESERERLRSALTREDEYIVKNFLEKNRGK